MDLIYEPEIIFNEKIINRIFCLQHKLVAIWKKLNFFAFLQFFKFCLDSNQLVDIPIFDIDPAGSPSLQLVILVLLFKLSYHFSNIYYHFHHLSAKQ